MLKIHTLTAAKKTARALEKALADSSIGLAHGKALDVVARLCGHPDWNVMASSLSEDRIDAQLHDFERAHIQGAQDCAYGPELELVTESGFMLRYPAALDYVRVCDPLGREVAYWVDDEWHEDPSDVLGALLGALVRQHKPVAARAASTPVPPSVAPAGVEDLPFNEVSNVLVNDAPYSVYYRDAEVLSHLASPADAEGAPDEDTPAITLACYDDDGFSVESFALTLEKLRSLRWDESLEAFRDPAGNTYAFYVEKRYSPKPSQAVLRT